MQLNSIDSLALGGLGKVTTTQPNNAVGGSGFSDLLNAALKEVNDKQLEAYDSMHQIASGKVNNLQEAVMKIDEAELSLKLALEVKNKAISAYKEVMRMQI